MAFLAILAAIALVFLFVTRPLWRTGARGGGAPRPIERDELAELEAAREAKYREIRDAELDLRTGKLSEADYEAVDAALRAEAIEILKELDQARERAQDSGLDDVGDRLPSSQA